MSDNIYFSINKLSTIFFIVLNLLCFNITAQNNLIPNGSFEDLSPCPATGAQSINYAIPWFQPNFATTTPGGSSDIFNNCITNTNYSTPNNVLNYQIPRTGNSYAGITLLENIGIDSNRFREYIEVKLIDSLRQGKKYCFKFFVSYANVLQSSYVINNLGCYFSIDSLLDYSLNRYLISVTPQILSTITIDDTLNWVEISGTYTAYGGESFITIGNFFEYHNLIIDTMTNDSGGFIFPAYYFVDDVSIYEQPDVFAGNDTLIQIGDTVQLGIPGRPDVFYSWSPAGGLSSPNISNPYAYPTVSTTYVLSVTDTNDLACTPKFYDTVIVWVGAVGVVENQSNINAYKIYPNPANDRLYIEPVAGAEKYSVELINTTGQTLLRREESGKAEIDVSGLQDGLYFIKYVCENRTEIRKFTVIKQNNP